MRRVHIFVEGQTEETFVRELLYEYFMMGLDVGHANFLPNLIVHEFEGLLYSDPKKFANWFDDKAVQRLCEERRIAASPEHINDGPTTVPSKRIVLHCPPHTKRKKNNG